MSESEQTMRRYLLGELSESEQSALEEKYFNDPEVFNQILKTESELVDAYARGQLPRELRDRVEKFYMDHPARAERVKFAEAFTSRIDALNESVANSASASWWQRLIVSLRGQSPTLRLSIAFAVLLIMLGVIWVVVKNQRQREELQNQTANNAQQQNSPQPTNDATPTPVQLTENQPTPAVSPEPKTSPTSKSVSLALTVGGVRGGPASTTPTVVISADTTQVQLLLNLKESGYPTYQATLQTIAGVEVFRQTNLKPRRSPTFTFTIPASKLESGDYVLTLTGASADGETENLSKSLFRVEKK